MANIKIGALGGLGENGKNMTIVEVDSRIFILDCGLKYPESICMELTQLYLI